MAYELHALEDLFGSWEYVDTFEDKEEAMNVGSRLSTFLYFEVWDDSQMMFCASGTSCAGRRALNMGLRSLGVIGKDDPVRWQKEGF